MADVVFSKMVVSYLRKIPPWILLHGKIGHSSFAGWLQWPGSTWVIPRWGQQKIPFVLSGSGIEIIESGFSHFFIPFLGWTSNTPTTKKSFWFDPPFFSHSFSHLKPQIATWLSAIFCPALRGTQGQNHLRRFFETWLYSPRTENHKMINTAWKLSDVRCPCTFVYPVYPLWYPFFGTTKSRFPTFDSGDTE